MSIYDLESIRGFGSSVMEEGMERETVVGITQRKITCFISAFQIFVCSFTLIYNLDALGPLCTLCCHKAEHSDLPIGKKNLFNISTVYLWQDWKALERTFAYVSSFSEFLLWEKTPVISVSKEISMSQTMFRFAKFHCKNFCNFHRKILWKCYSKVTVSYLTI